MDKEINDSLDEIHADVQRYEQQQRQQQQRQQQEPEDVDPYELMYMNAFVVNSPHSPVVSHEQQQHQQQEPKDADLDELMLEIIEIVDQYSLHSPVANPLSPGTHLLYIISLCFHCSKICVRARACAPLNQWTKSQVLLT